MASGSGVAVCVTATSESLKRDILQRLHDRLVHILERQPLDITGLRHNFVIFGGIDGYSRKIMYLKVADNIRSSDTHSAFFNEAVNKHGFPLRCVLQHPALFLGPKLARHQQHPAHILLPLPFYCHTSRPAWMSSVRRGSFYLPFRKERIRKEKERELQPAAEGSSSLLSWIKAFTSSKEGEEDEDERQLQHGSSSVLSCNRPSTSMKDEGDESPEYTDKALP